MGLLSRLKEHRAAKKEDRAAIAREFQQERRAGDDPGTSMAEKVDNVAAQFPRS
jgi:hypothetical protein